MALSALGAGEVELLEFVTCSEISKCAVPLTTGEFESFNDTVYRIELHSCSLSYFRFVGFKAVRLLPRDDCCLT
jgi:hypothetical protein